AAVVLLAAFAGHNAPAVTTADAEAILPLEPAPAPAPPAFNVSAGAAEIHTSTTVPAPAAAPKKWLPSGKGMWIYVPDKTEGGNVSAIVAKAKATGLTHLWVRMGSAWDGFNVAPFFDKLLPAAHAANIKVIGWDFPKLDPMGPDLDRARAMINFTSSSGDRIDAFSPDIESPAEGTRLTPDNAKRYGAALREIAGPDYTLIVTVPRPAKERPTHPYNEIVAGYDAIAPMIYWLDRQPDTDVAGALQFLSKYNVPIYPVGQAYDGSPEGGRKGVPPPDELWRFTRFAEKNGAAGVSFWSWQAADQRAWNAIKEAVEFRPPEVVTQQVAAVIALAPQEFSP
ncbi:MAG TPA: hypothetical protein VJ653_08220, partial [Acidimicrobiales bacterium]|nr:hypothetical protein [Acidimicrobiales bacterium]